MVEEKRISVANFCNCLWLYGIARADLAKAAGLADRLAADRIPVEVAKAAILRSLDDAGAAAAGAAAACGIPEMGKVGRRVDEARKALDRGDYGKVAVEAREAGIDLLVNAQGKPCWGK